MTARALILRETAISVAVNVVLSVGFFLALFGTAGPFALGAVATDFFPQAFMVALMGTLVPSLIVNRRFGGAVPPIVLRCLALAVASAALAGGSGWWGFSHHAAVTLALAPMLAIKAAFGGGLAAIVTPIAMRLLTATSRQDTP